MAVIGGIVLALGIALIQLGNYDLVFVAIVGALVTISSMLLFVGIIIRGSRQQTALGVG